MGEVYRAKDAKLDRTVALKFIAPEFTHDPEAKARFIREAKAASAIDHPNICTIHEVDETADGRLFIVMAHYEGESLKERIARGPLTLDESVDMVQQVARGLAKAHAQNIVHRDIKPANIFLTTDGMVKLVDFGVAKLLDNTQLTRTGGTFGTLAYMSPEQVQGGVIDTRSDLWSLGVVLYEMVTGILPFQSVSAAATMYAIINEDAGLLSSHRDVVPPLLESIACKALRKNAGERYQDADEILADLTGLDGKPGTRESRHSLLSGGGKAARKRRIGPVAGAAVAVALLLGIIAFWPPLHRRSSPVNVMPIAVIGFENRTGDAAYDYLKEAIPNLLITSLEQSRSFRVMTWERMQDLLARMERGEVEAIDSSLGFEVCRMDDVQVLVTGSVTSAGDVFATDIKVLDVATKALLESASSRGRGPASILEKQIDELTSQIVRGIPRPEAGEAETLPGIADVTTRSFAAYREFQKGRDAYLKYYDDQAIRDLRAAVAIDGDFAVAHLYLAWALRGSSESREAISRAMNLAERASDKERLYIESSHARLIENDREKEARLLEQLVSKYPQEKLAYWCLGVNYRSEGLYGRALAALGEALSLDPGYAPALNSIAYAYADSNDFERAFAYFERYATMTPLDANPYDSMADIHVRMGDLDVALGKYEQAIALRPDFFASHAKIWYLHGLNENYDRALQSLDRFINSTSTPAIKGHGFKWRGFCDFWLGKRDTCLYELRLSADLAPDEVAKSLTDYILGWVYLHLGEIETGRRYCDSAIEVFNRGATPGRRALHGTLQAYFHGLSFLQADDTAAARTCLEQLEARLAEVEPVYSPTLEHCARCLRAEVMLAEGDPERAAAIFRTARRYALDHIHDVTIVPLNLSRQDVAARAYLASGDTAQAIAEYERLVSANANERGRLFVEPRDHYRLGVLYQDAGRLAEAAAEFGKFVEIWKDARPMPADMVDAGNRLEGMKRIPAG